VKPCPRSRVLLILALITIFNLTLCSCTEDGEPIDKPDEFTHIYEFNEKYILRAIAQVFKDKTLGKAATVNEDTREVTSDYIVQGEWRTRSLACVRHVNRNEREVTLSVITEKKTSTGWQMRRLLGKEQYARIFDAIDSQIYREMYKLE